MKRKVSIHSCLIARIQEKIIKQRELILSNFETEIIKQNYIPEEIKSTFK
jgi:hypothetical protein